MPAAPLIDAVGLVKDYGDVRALAGLDLRVAPGEIYGLLGPNGAGKTTTLRILAALDRPTSGRLMVAGFDPSDDAIEVKKRVGYVAETAILYESLTPREYFEFVASTRRLDRGVVKRASTLADAFDLGSHYDVPIGALSLGTKQKIAIIAAVMHSPPLLLLDEPLNGLDAKSGRILKEVVSLHARGGGGVVFSSHIMEVAEAMCTRIGIVNEGRVVAEGTMEELRALSGRRDSSLEELFLKLTEEEGFVAETIGRLREDASRGP
ncbi:MAG: ABC transporter ATP-binding protein [Nitrososphaerota archaeon]|nr:ABC transporter ATP-binding protein [Nitrososphaerota archaeon]